MESTAKVHKWALVIGAALWFVSFVFGLFLPQGTLDVESNLFITLSVTRRWILSSLLFILLVPLYAEGLFRYWGTGGRIATIVSLVGMALGAGIVCIKADGKVGIVESVLAVASVCVMLILVLRRDVRQGSYYVIFIMGSTFVWITYYLVHVDSVMPVVLAVGVAKLMGLALVCCYLVINHGLIYAIGVHVVNNLIVALPLLVANVSNDNRALQVDGANVTLQRVFTEERMQAKSEGQWLVQGSIGEIAGFVAQQSDNPRVLFKTGANWVSLNYRFNAQSDQPLSAGAILSSMAEGGLVVLDTAYEALWILDVPEGADIENLDRGEGRLITLARFVDLARKQYHVPLMLYPTINPELQIRFPRMDAVASRCQTFSEFIDYVEERCCMTINMMPYDKACVVTIDLP